MIGGLATQSLCRMSKSMTQLASETKQITIATMFSGGEMFFMCLVGLMSIVTKMFGVTLEPQLEWNVEKDFWKREFSNSRFPPKHSFDDLIALSNNGWSGTDSISGEKHMLYTTDICAAGFECDTVCKLARDSKGFWVEEVRSFADTCPNDPEGRTYLDIWTADVCNRGPGYAVRAWSFDNGIVHELPKDRLFILGCSNDLGLHDGADWCFQRIMECKAAFQETGVEFANK